MNQNDDGAEALGPMPISDHAYKANGNMINCSELTADDYRKPTDQHGCRNKG